MAHPQHWNMPMKITFIINLYTVLIYSFWEEICAHRVFNHCILAKIHSEFLNWLQIMSYAFWLQFIINCILYTKVRTSLSLVCILQTSLWHALYIQISHNACTPSQTKSPSCLHYLCNMAMNYSIFGNQL